MISAIGFKPVIAAPIAAPRIACSEIGVSLKYPAGLADVLAEKHHVGIARHLLGDAAGHRFAVRQFRHAKPPSA
jgi:hypothetical protein